MFASWPTAAKWIVLCVTALAFLSAGTAAYFGWKSEVRQKAQLEMLAKSLAKTLKDVNDRRGIETDVTKLPVDRLLACNAATPGTPNFECCYADRKCPAVEALK